MSAWFRVQSIGTVLRLDEPGGEPGVYFDPFQPAVIEIDQRWENGLAGIEDYSHLVVLFYLDRVQRRRASGKHSAPEGHAGLPSVGFFATRTPKRPNPIGISCPQLTGREDTRLTVVGLDAWHGTPVLDIKGYSPRDELRPNWSVPSWLEALWVEHDIERQGGQRPWEPAD